MVRVLFVCLGNICRSPTAHGVFQKQVDDASLSELITVDSAGTAAWHEGKAPDPRSTSAAKRRGYDLSVLRARQATTDDFYQFDYVLAMDNSNLDNLMDIAPHDGKTRPVLFLPNYSQQFSEIEVPDPYYGGDEGFEHVLDLIEDAATGLLKEIRSTHSL